MKLQTSRDPEADPKRLATVRDAVGPDVEIFGDANGALDRKDAVYWAARFAEEWMSAGSRSR